jgi:arginase
MMDTRVILVRVPYHLGRVGGGSPEGVAVLAETLADKRAVDVTVTVDSEATNEIAASMDVIRALADTIRATDGLPFVLAGNCSSALGTVTGLGGDVGVVWLDAHGDFNTPETTQTGFFDGMGLAMLTGAGWDGLGKELVTVPEEHVVHVGGRDFDPGEEMRFEDSAVTLVRRPPVDDALDALRERVSDVYVHVDLDVLDPSVGRANSLAVDDGLFVRDLEEIIDAIAARFEIRAAALTWYEPDGDPERAVPDAARAIYERVVASRSVDVS